MGGPNFLLDAAGDAPVPTGYAVVATEAEFVSEALAPTPLLIRGASLCRWAEEFCIGRDYPWEVVRSVADRLRLYCPTLTEEQARQLQALLSDCGTSNVMTYQAREVLEALAPDGPWSERPSRDHAARWLLWLDEKTPNTALCPLLDQIAEQWTVDAPSGTATLYDCRTKEAARGALAAWLGITKSGPERNDWGDFPLAVPSRWRTQARSIWTGESVTERPRLLEAVKERRAPYVIREEAAQMASEYFQHHPKQLTPTTLACLEALLPEDAAARLRALCPPNTPDALPESVVSILDWFVSQYLPFRVWEQEHGDEAAHATAVDLAAQFEAWCLHFYPTALAGGLGSEHLAIRRSQRLRQSRSEWVTLWIVFDGLTYQDGQVLTRMLAEEPRLSLNALVPVVSPLPTITQFCKRSLIEGLPSKDVDAIPVVPSWEGSRVLERNREAGTALTEASLGDVFVLALTQPDKTYHEKHDAPSIRRDVQSELDRWARTIRDDASKVPNHLPLRIVFTTDHGRLLSVGARTVDVPAGMDAHGRAAYGPSGRSFDSTGTLRDEAAGIVYLGKDRFGLATDCAVALGSGVFKMSDGKTGQEWFPHGGLSPEEVLIPWGELTRDLAPPQMRASVSGQGRSGATQRAQVQLENLGTVSVRAVALILTVAGEVRSLPLEEVEVGPLSQVETSVEISRWPSGQQAEGLRGTVEFVMPGGTRVTVEASVSLRTQEMQSGRAAGLEDLL